MSGVLNEFLFFITVDFHTVYADFETDISIPRIFRKIPSKALGGLCVPAVHARHKICTVVASEKLKMTTFLDCFAVMTIGSITNRASKKAGKSAGKQTS